MTIKWTLLALLALTQTSTPSIVGVTYRDHFDFEQRYADPNECNPFYWHPLHLPGRCMEMFEKPIRKKAAANGPMRLLMKPKRQHESYDYYVPQEIEAHRLYEVFSPRQSLNQIEYNTRLNPYEEMMELLRNDISYLPTAPEVAVLPGLGLVALYQQPISKQSESSIKKVSKLYAKTMRRNPYPYSYYPYSSKVILKYSDDGVKTSTKEEGTPENLNEAPENEIFDK